jgi:poly(beta-D-mannuronate) lyase
MNGRTISVTDSTTLIGALLTAQPSDTIFLEDGTYNGNFTLAQSGKPRHPIVIRARTLHGALFGGKFTMSGDYGVLDGLRFSGPSGGVSIDGGDRNRVTRGLFRGFTSAAIQVRGGASYNRIDHNDIASPPQDTDDGSNKAYGIRVILKSGDQNTTSNIIDRNYIHDFPTRISSSINGHEAIQIGEGPVSTDWNIGTLIENNLLADVNLDSEALSLKASGNVVKGNTLTNSQAFLSNRHGYNNHWISNYVYQSVGLRVYGDDTRLIGNTMDGASLNILAGDTNQTAFSAQKSSSLTNSPAARNTLIVGNQGPIVVGYSYASKPTHIVQNTRLEANKSIAQRITGNETGTIELKETSITYIPAVRLTNQDVGPNSPDTACVD